MSAGVRGVRRWEHKGTRGWFVYLVRKEKNVALYKLFNDKFYGGRRGAFLAASRWRESMARRLGPPARHLCGRRTKDGKRGSVARRRFWHVARPGAVPRWVDRWEAVLAYKGRSYSRSYSCQRYGVRGAREYATRTLLEWRRAIALGKAPRRAPKP